MVIELKHLAMGFPPHPALTQVSSSWATPAAAGDKEEARPHHSHAMSFWRTFYTLKDCWTQLYQERLETHQSHSRQ